MDDGGHAGDPAHHADGADSQVVGPLGIEMTEDVAEHEPVHEASGYPGGGTDAGTWVGDPAHAAARPGLVRLR